MRRRDAKPGPVQIPPEVLNADGDYTEDWAAWCDETGYNKLMFLREAVHRRREQARRLYEAEHPGHHYAW